MPAAALALGIGSILLVFLAIPVSTCVPVPFLGAVLSFGAPIVGLAACILGGISRSRAVRDGMPTGLPTSGIITGAIGFFVGIPVALICGVCNTLCSAAQLDQARNGSRPRMVYDPDSGTFTIDNGNNPPGFPPVRGPDEPPPNPNDPAPEPPTNGPAPAIPPPPIEGQPEAPPPPPSPAGPPTVPPAPTPAR